MTQKVPEIIKYDKVEQQKGNQNVGPYIIFMVFWILLPYML